MRQQGRLTDWNDDRGFGYITPLDGGPTVFVHISEFPSDRRRPCVTDLLAYEVGTDDRGRARAVAVRFLSAAHARTTQQHPTSPSGHVSVLVTIGLAVFMLPVCLLAGLGAVSWLVPIAYVVMSGVAFVAYAQDKAAAQSGQWRIPEGNLILIGFLCGWPGALIAQEILRHKTRKQPFRSVFWVSVIMNIALLAWLAMSGPRASLS